MSAPRRIGLLGASGRMGTWVTQLLAGEEFSSRAELAAKASSGEPTELLLSSEVVIDFSLPEAMAALAKDALAVSTRRELPAFVIGSTGWKPSERALIDELAERAPILIASNFSTGVNALVEILRGAAPMLRSLGFSPSIVEAHHQHKKDSPSGTALLLARTISPKSWEDIEIHSIRTGEVIGDHEITYSGPGEHLTLGHFAEDRSIFARGAINAALWLASERERGAKGHRSMSEYLAAAGSSGTGGS